MNYAYADGFVLLVSFRFGKITSTRIHMHLVMITLHISDFSDS